MLVNGDHVEPSLKEEVVLRVELSKGEVASSNDDGPGGELSRAALSRVGVGAVTHLVQLVELEVGDRVFIHDDELGVTADGLVGLFVADPGSLGCLTKSVEEGCLPSVGQRGPEEVVSLLSGKDL